MRRASEKLQCIYGCADGGQVAEGGGMTFNEAVERMAKYEDLGYRTVEYEPLFMDGFLNANANSMLPCTGELSYKTQILGMKHL
jgi:hypothetical protein